METNAEITRRRVKAYGMGCLLPLLLIFAGGYGFWKFAEYRRLMSLPPADIGVAGLLYHTEKSWGMPLLAMPGDNETGFVVYALSDAAGAQIKAEGVAFFSRPENVAQRVDYQRAYDKWRETPIEIDRDWASDAPKDRPPNINDFLDKYGFAIPVDSKLVAQVNDAISKPGSYYAYGRGGGLVIVIPQTKRVIFTYAG